MRIRLTAIASLAPVVLFLAACADSTAPSSARTMSASSPSYQFGTTTGGETGGGSTGGGSTGGGGTPTSPPPAPCATITSFSNSTGYYSVWAAIWTPYSFTSSCGFTVTVTMTYLNGNTGVVDFLRTSSTPNGTVDEDWAAFSTPYTVTMTLTDPWGKVLASRNAVVTTKAGKTPGA